MFDSPILIAVKFLAGFPLLLFGADWVVKGASRLAVAWGISALVVGLTVVAYGTSAPELAVTIMAVWSGEGSPDIAVGNVVGSNIANILLVLGVAAVVAPLVVAPVVVKRSMPLVIFISFLALAFAWDWNGDGHAVVTWWQGLILVAGAALYTWRAMRRGSAENKVQDDDKMLAELEEEVKEELAHMQEEGRFGWAIELGRIVAGLLMLVLGANWLVGGAVAVAQWLGVGELIIALTIVAIGTSLPEVATCVVAVLRGHRDIAVGNAVGSNVFNILLVLGMCSFVAPGGGVEVSPQAMTADIPIMIAVAIAALPVFFTGYVIARWEGAMFLVFYAAYTVYLILREINHGLLMPFVHLMLWGVLPLTMLVLAVHSAMDFFAGRPSSAKEDRAGP